MKKIGILVGHFGRGTGASYENRDEWILSRRDAFLVQNLLNQDEEMQADVIILDHKMHPFDLLLPLLSKWGYLSFKNILNIDLRAAWAIRSELDLAIELHYNSAINKSAEGHEIFISRDASQGSLILAGAISRQLNLRIGNKDRGIKRKNFRILRKLNPHIPVCILEPAFIWEPAVGVDKWALQYARALRDGITETLKTI